MIFYKQNLNALSTKLLLVIWNIMFIVMRQHSYASPVFRMSRYQNNAKITMYLWHMTSVFIMVNYFTKAYIFLPHFYVQWKKEKNERKSIYLEKNLKSLPHPGEPPLRKNLEILAPDISFKKIYIHWILITKCLRQKKIQSLRCVLHYISSLCSYNVQCTYTCI
jgi:hypothetical protein